MFNYIFIPAGSVVRREADLLLIYDDKHVLQALPYGKTFVLDVGNSLGDGIIDHHQPGTEDLCVASIIMKNPEECIGRHLKDSDKYYLVTHLNPDFDALGSAYLAERYIKERSLPDFAINFVDYILEVDSGKKQLNREHTIEPFSLVLAISESIRMDSTILPKDKDLQNLKQTFRLFDLIWDVLSEGYRLKDGDWEILTGYQKYISLIKYDFAIYTADLRERSEVRRVKLNKKDSDGSSSVDCLITKFPQSILWKYWGRGETDYSPNHKGFTMTVAFLPSKNTRAIIAVDPTSKYTLRGLGLYIDYLEMTRLLENNSIGNIVGKKRPGFHRQNPWYDGRSAMHNFTIIDTPREGSKLPEDAIIDATLNYTVWNNAFPEREYGDLKPEEIMVYFDRKSDI